jgi:hypothetical protein
MLRQLQIILGQRLLLAIAAATTIFAFPATFSRENYAMNEHWPADAAPTRLSPLKTWDAQHYLYLSRQGYHPGQQSNRFYPAWPYVIHWGSWATGGNELAAGLVLANALSIAALLVLHRMVLEQHGEKAANAAFLFLLTFPGVFFLSLVYSEALFLFLSVVVFRFLFRRAFLRAGLMALLLPLARPVGPLIVIPFAYAVCANWRKERRVRLADLACVGLPLLGIAAYFLFMRHATGNAFDAVSMQRLNASDASIAKLLHPLRFLGELFMLVPTVVTTVYDRLSFVLFVAALIAMWKTERMYFWYALPMGLIPAMSLSLSGFTRHVTMVFPVFIVVGIWMCNSRYRDYIVVAAAGMLVLQITLFLLHINNYWVG